MFTGPDEGNAVSAVAIHSPLPVTVNVYGLSSVSLLIICITAVRTPTAVGLNSISKLLDPKAAIGVAGNAEIAKSPVSPLKTVTLVIIRSVVPAKFSILKVFAVGNPINELPKSVPSKVLGVVSPSAMSGKLAVVPSTLISGPTGVHGEMSEFIPGEPPLSTSQ